MDIYYVDGEFLPEDQAVLSVKDIAVLRGYGCFDFMRTYNRRAFHLDAHIDRLLNSAKLIGLDLRWSKDEIRKAVIDTMAKNPQHAEANIRLVVTGGVSSNGVVPEGKGKLLVMVTEKHGLPDWWYNDGAKVITVDVERYIPGAKSINYMNAVMANMEAKKQDAIEAIYVDRDNRILEGTTTNFFAFKDGKLITTGEDILSGITRMVLLDILKDEFEIEIRDIKKDELNDFDEIFITASNKEIVPVVKIDDLVIADGKPGANTRKVMDLFRAYTAEYGKAGEAAA